jgi:tetratricopeptide (TPR) repeat protein
MSKAKPKPKTNRRPKAAAGSAVSKQTALALMAGLLVALFLVYSPVLQTDFINYDDDIYITENPLIQNPSAANVQRLFTTYYYNQYSPVAMLLMAAQFKAFGSKVVALKAASILLHLANVLLVFLLVRQLFRRFDYAFITAGLFGLHPLQVESVAWLTASMKIGAFALFSLGALLAYAHYVEKKKASLFWVSLFLFLLACFSKEQAIALAPALLAIDYLRKRPLLSRPVLLEKLPFFLIALAFGIATLFVAEDMQSAQMVVYYNPWERLVFASFAFASYLAKLVLPLNLSAFYTYPLKGAIPFYYYLSLPVAAAVLYGLYYAWKKEQRLVAFGILFFLIHIALTLLSQVLSVREVMMADRYVYLPSIGFFLLLAYGIDRLGSRRPGWRKAAWGALALYGLLLAVLTYQRAPVWKDSITLFTDVIEKGKLEQGKYNPFLALAYNNRGIARKEAGNTQAALEDYNLAIASNTSYAKAYLNRANIAFSAGQYEEALKDYNQSLQLDSTQAQAYSSRGSALASLSRIQQALEDFNRAVALDPNFADAVANRALAHYTLRQFAAALPDIDHYLSLQPGAADMINMKALCLLELGRLPEAEQEFNRAVQLDPSDGALYLNRSIFFSRTGRREQARQDALRAQALGVAVDADYLQSLN